MISQTRAALAIDTSAGTNPSTPGVVRLGRSGSIRSCIGANLQRAVEVTSLTGLRAVAAGQGKEHVVEGRLMQLEAFHQFPFRVDLVQQGQHVVSTAVGGQSDSQPVFVPPDDAGAERAAQAAALRLRLVLCRSPPRGRPVGRPPPGTA